MYVTICLHVCVYSVTYAGLVSLKGRMLVLNCHMCDGNWTESFAKADSAFIYWAPAPQYFWFGLITPLV